MQILIIQTAFLGDVVLATPVLEKLHRIFPDAAIDFLLRKGNESLLKDHPFIRETVIWEKKEGKWKNVFKLIRRFRKTRYDYVINLQRFATSGIITALAGGKMSIGFDKNPLSFLFTKRVPHHIAKRGELYVHEVGRNLACIASFTDDSAELPKLYPSVIDFEKTASYKKLPFITMAPASVWFTKQFPKEKWVELIKALGDRYSIYLLGAPGDWELCQEIIDASGMRRAENLCGKLSLLQSAALMKDALMNYVNDSAPLHIASAMDAPVTVIYCSTIPEFGFGPSGTRGHVVEIEGSLYCRPCGLHGHKKCPEGHFKCGYEIKEERLLELLPL
ncbi:MAG: glycosyltransferase family 9 protein [Chitinophagaceae bacterium]